jgi:hypothetical protein
VVNALVETLGFRHIGIHKEKYAVSNDMKMSVVVELERTSTVVVSPSRVATATTSPGGLR